MNLYGYVNITECFYMENLCVAFKILESHSKGTVMIIVCVFCKWQSMVLIINLEAFFCEIFVLLAYFSDDHHKITCGKQCSRESNFSDLH